MLWLVPTWILSLIAIFFVGYHYRGLTKKIEYLEEVIKSKIDKKPEPEEPKSTIIDPLDEVQEAIYEHKRMMARLNPEE